MKRNFCPAACNRVISRGYGRTVLLRSSDVHDVSRVMVVSMGATKVRKRVLPHSELHAMVP